MSARILMVAGGTGGHIFPALAVAEELRSREHTFPCTFEFLGTHRPLESKLIPAAGFPLRQVNAGGLKGIRGIERLRNLLLLPRTAFEVAGLLREYAPSVVVGIGGYLAGPVMFEAALGDVPTLLIEPNAWPGLTNRLLAPLVRGAALGFEGAARFFGEKARVTGLPVRSAFFEIPPRTPATPFTILVIGGSQGARAINQVLEASLARIAREIHGIRIIHQTGEHDYDEVRKAYQRAGFPADVCAFIENMPGALREADLVISRAGATTVAELAAAGRPALLIPLPSAADNHQVQNACAFAQAGAGRVILEAELTPQRLVREVRDLVIESDRLFEMGACARRLARPDAARRIADWVEELAVNAHI